MMSLKLIIQYRRRNREVEKPDYSELKKNADTIFRIWQKVIFWVVIFVGSFLLYFIIHFKGLVLEDAMNLAQVGRDIALGKGFANTTVFPCYLNGHSPISDYSPPHPPPLYGLIQAACFMISGYQDTGAVMAGAVFFMVTSLLTYALARRLFSHKVALLVFLFTFTNPVLLRSSINGLPTAFLSFLVVLLFYGMEVLPIRYGAGWGGIIIGLGFLSDYSWSFFLIPVLLYYFILDRKDLLANVGIFLAGFCVVISPWLIEEIASGRNSYLTILNFKWKSSTGLFPVRSALGSYGLPFQSVSLTSALVIGKLHQGLSLLYRGGLTVSGNFIGLLFWVSLLYKMPGDRLREHRWLLCLLLGGAGVWSVITTHRAEVLIPFLPLIILFGTAVFFRIICWCGPLKKPVFNLILSGFILLNCWPSIIAVRNVPEKDRKETLDSLNYLRTLVREDELVATDIPELVNWYGYRRAVRIPVNILMFEEMTENYPEIKFLLLSPRVMNEIGWGLTSQWRKVYLSKSLPGKVALDQVMLLPGRMVLMGKKTILLNRISSRW